MQRTLLIIHVLLVLTGGSDNNGIRLDSHVQIRGEDTNMDINCWIQQKVPFSNDSAVNWMLSPLKTSSEEFEYMADGNSSSAFLITSELVEIHECLGATTSQASTRLSHFLLQLHLIVRRKASCLHALMNHSLEGSCLSTYLDSSESFVLSFRCETPEKIAEMDEEGNLRIYICPRGSAGQEGGRKFLSSALWWKNSSAQIYHHDLENKKVVNFILGMLAPICVLLYIAFYLSCFRNSNSSQDANMFHSENI